MYTTTIQWEAIHFRSVVVFKRRGEKRGHENNNKRKVIGWARCDSERDESVVKKKE